AYRRANVRARELGRILGARRTIDVLKEDLAAHFTAEGLTPGHTPTFVAKLDALGDAAMAHIRSELPPERFLRDGMRVLELVVRAKDDTTSLGALAAPHLAARIADVAPLVAIIDVPHEVEQHHELRIALKHLRYAAEILREVMPERIDADETITPIKRVQDALGTLNDAQELAALARAHRTEPEALALPDGGRRALDALVEDLGGLATSRYEAARAMVHDVVPRVLSRLRALT
ncbi:CHAD domain-containing protein, partial [Myxococcota bacterium]|nr:CHAD domain-containing protein [Myxococcota bacterium]